MAEVLEGFEEHALRAVPPVAPTEVDEAAIRRLLREQVARLEGELGALFCSTYPRTGFEWNVGSRGGPRGLSLRELEGGRGELGAERQPTRRMLPDPPYVEEMHRCRIEEMLLEPKRHKYVRVRAEDIGERGCKQWHVLPRFGLIGILMNWWRVKISSGCPLARGLRPPFRDG